MPNAIRDAIALSIFQHADDQEPFDLVLRRWHYQDTEPLIRMLAHFVASYANTAHGDDARDDLQNLAYVAAASTPEFRPELRSAV